MHCQTAECFFIIRFDSFYVAIGFTKKKSLSSFQSNSRAYLIASFADEVVVFVCFCFLAVGGRLCHRASDKITSLSEDP